MLGCLPSRSLFLRPITFSIQKIRSNYDCTRKNILLTKDSKVIVQGFTGKSATEHSKLCLKYGTKIVGGINPKKGGKKHLGLPIFATVAEAKKCLEPHATLIFVPPPAGAKVSGVFYIKSFSALMLS